MTDKSIILIIDGKDKSSGAPSNFRYNLNKLPMQKIYKFRVNKVIIPYTWYAVEDQTFSINYNGTNYAVPMPAGNYSGPSLAIAFQNAVNAAVPAPGISVVYNFNTNKMDFSALPGNTYWFDFSAYAQRANYNVGVAVGMVLPSDVSVVLGPQSVFSSTYQVYLIASECLYLKSQNLRVLNTSYFQTIPDDVIQTIPVNVNSFNVITWENKLATDFYMSETNIPQLDFQLVDRYNNLINLNSYEITIELQVYTAVEI